ncbi:MAG: translation initiation factor IF-5A [Candidatus Baldrarchaeia archaeon]
MSSKVVGVGTLKEGSYIIIDGEPCKIVSLEKSKPGKHGAAKARIVAMGLFDGVKRSIIKPVDAKIEVPVVNKRVGQVISLRPLMIMDLENPEICFETEMPEEEELASKITEGVQVEYWDILGRKKIVRVKSTV